ncbi:MAG: carotenoid biosynthesis protein [Alphaproteobacteria bacterium]|nr:carotenoid biosynthesis protein [Alphaproteobacteria bacterium]
MGWGTKLALAHAMAVLGAVFSLVVLIPHPELWAGLPGSNTAFQVAMQHGGPLHIVLGAAAMLAVGQAAFGWRRTLVWFGCATAISLTMELLGTGTGWPFGAYAYTHGLGPKVLGRVPFVIPLSWYYLGFSAWLVAAVGLRRLGVKAAWPAVLLGVWLLMAWDLVLDPAMAHPDLPVKFWVWHERGAYVGMPLVNLVGWIGTGLLFIGLGRALWGDDEGLERVPVALPFGIYVLNVGFGAVLCASVGLWAPIVLALVAGIAPATIVWWRRPVPPDPQHRSGDVADVRDATVLPER